MRPLDMREGLAWVAGVLLAAIDEAKKLLVAYMPYKVQAHRIFTDMAHPWVLGYQRNIYRCDFWQYIDIDAALQARQFP